MAASLFSVFFVFCLLLTEVNVFGKDQGANTAVADALARIRAYPAYRLTRSLEADLAPGSSGVVAPVKITDTAVTLVVHTGTVIRAHESSTIRESISTIRIFSHGGKETKTTVWDGSWIYSWGHLNTGTKMVDADANRSVAIVESLYAALLKDDSLHLCGEESLDGQHCVVLESLSEILTPFLYIPGKAMIRLNKVTGFPVRITVQSQKSRATVNYTGGETNPVYRSEMFIVPTNIVFVTIKGQEDMHSP